MNQRNNELQDIEDELRIMKQDLAFTKQTKKKVEIELNDLMKQRKHAMKDLNLFDKRADETAIELIIAQQELDSVSERKSKLESDMVLMKNELNIYLNEIKNCVNEKLLKADSIDLGEPIMDQREQLRRLNAEISERKNEIDELKERILRYLKEFRLEIKQNENELIKLKNEKMATLNELNSRRCELDDVESELKAKAHYLSECTADLEKLGATRRSVYEQNEAEANRLKQLLRTLDEKQFELDKYEEALKRQASNIELLIVKEKDLARCVDELGAQYRRDKQKLDDLRERVEEERRAEEEVRGQVEEARDELRRLSDEYEERRRELSKSYELLERKHQKEAADFADIDRTMQLKRLELDKLEQSIKTAGEKLRECELDLAGLSEKRVQSKYDKESMERKCDELDFQYNDLLNKLKYKQQYLEELNERTARKQEESDYLESCLQRLKSDYFNEKSRNMDELSGMQTENMSYVMDNLSREYETKLNERANYIGQLEAALKEKTNELSYYKEALEHHMRCLERVDDYCDQSLQKQQPPNELNDCLASSALMFDTDVKSFLKNLENDSNTRIVQPSRSQQQQQQQNNIGALLFTPKLKKSVHISNESTMINKTYTIDTSSQTTAGTRDDKEMIRKINERLDEKITNLAHSKHQTKSLIENLKSTLNQIELMTAYNIFKITSINNSNKI